VPRNTPSSLAPIAAEIIFETAGGEMIDIPAHDFLQSLEITFADQAAWTGSLRFFDHEGDYLENLLIATGAHRRIFFRWGWDVGRGVRENPLFTGTVLKYTPTFTPEGVEIQMDLAQDEAFVQVLDKKFRSWGEEATASEIFREIAADRHWKMVDVNGNPTVEDTVGQVGPLNLKGESDLKFIMETLLPKAQNSQGQRFKFTFGRVGEAHFHSTSFLPRLAAEYNFARSAMGDVISFAPSEDVVFSDLWGRGNAVYYAVDSAEGTRSELETTDKGGSPEAANIVHPDAAYFAQIDGAVKAAIPFIARDAEELERQVHHHLQHFRDASYPAELEVRGTHAMALNEYVTVNYYKQDGQLHYLSGTFRVQSLTHNYDTGGWRTALQLYREGTKVPPGGGQRADTDRQIAAPPDKQTQNLDTEATALAEGRPSSSGVVTVPVREP